MKKGFKRIITAALAAMFMITQLPMLNSKAAAGISMYGKAHVQTYADTNGKIVNENGIDTLVLGTRGQAKRVESVTINLQNNTGYTGTIQYRVHRQTYGWTNWLDAGQPAGTTGQKKRLEAIQIRLTGELAQHYNVRYRVHIQTYGDAQGWVYNGALAGTTGEAKRLEEVKVQIIPKTATENASVNYRVHRQTYGWEMAWAKNGAVSGTTGEAKRLEAISIDVKGSSYNGSVEYQTHVQTYGWMNWVADGAMSGTSGEAKRLEAIRIRLTGELAQHYDIYYRVHAQTFGWMGWAKNGEAAGTAAYAKRLEAIQILLVKKGNAAPASTVNGITQTTNSSFKDADQPNNTGNTGKENNTDTGNDNKKPENTETDNKRPEEKPVWYPAKTQTVTYYQCDNCKNIYRTKKELKEHFEANDPKYDIVSDCANKKGGSKTQTFTIRDGYWSNQEVPEENKVVWVKEEDAVEYTADVIEKIPYSYCSTCKKRFYPGKSIEENQITGGIAEDGEGASEHMKKNALAGTPHNGIIDGNVEERVIGQNNVVEPEYGHYEVQ